MLLFTEDELRQVEKGAEAFCAEVIGSATISRSLLETKKSVDVYYSNTQGIEQFSLHSNVENDNVAIARSHLFMSSVDSVGYYR